MDHRSIPARSPAQPASRPHPGQERFAPCCAGASIVARIPSQPACRAAHCPGLFCNNASEGFVFSSFYQHAQHHDDEWTPHYHRSYPFRRAGSCRQGQGAVEQSRFYQGRRHSGRRKPRLDPRRDRSTRRGSIPKNFPLPGAPDCNHQGGQRLACRWRLESGRRDSGRRWANRSLTTRARNSARP